MCPASLGGLCSDIGPPMRRFVTLETDANGHAQHVFIAPNIPDVRMCFQAFAQRGPNGI